MANVTQKHVQEVLVKQVAQQAADIVRQQAAQQAAIARTGSPEPSAQNSGYYDESGHWQGYLRCDVDAFNSGKKYGP
ncbi:MAG: hypothetical protein JO316_15630 [Abitibacteriaceae bacterium]|nr:hypothetical protein [Abditibacteriaceae bacterium]